MPSTIRLLAVVVIVCSAGAARAGDLHRLLSWRMCWPSCIQKTCCDDYCPKPMPCVKPICCFGCDDYCSKCEPCVKRICCFGCDDYCPKCPPVIRCAPCQDLKCVPTGCAPCGCGCSGATGSASATPSQTKPSGTTGSASAAPSQTAITVEHSRAVRAVIR